MKGEGAVSGVSDLILLVSNGEYNSLCIEMKYGNGRQSENQKEWQKLAEEYGNKYVICRSFEEFTNEIRNYLKDRRFNQIKSVRYI